MEILVIKTIITLIIIKLSKKFFPTNKTNRILYIMSSVVVSFNFSDGMTFIIMTIITIILFKKTKNKKIFLNNRK